MRVILALLVLTASSVFADSDELLLTLSPDVPAAGDSIRFDASFYTTVCAQGVMVEEVGLDRVDIFSLEPCFCPLPAFNILTERVELGSRPSGEIDVHYAFRFTDDDCGPVDQPIASASFFVDGAQPVVTTTEPDVPQAGESVMLRVDYIGGCAVDAVEITRDGDTVQVVGLENICPEVPPPYTFEAPIGVFDSGVHFVEIFLECRNPNGTSAGNPITCQDTSGPRMIARRELLVTPLAFADVRVIPPSPRSDEFFEIRFSSSCATGIEETSIDGSIIRFDVSELPLGSPLPCTDPPSYDNGVLFAPQPAGQYVVLGVGPDDPTDGSNDFLFSLPFTITPADDQVAVDDGRFVVEAIWRDFAGATGTARGSALAGDSAGLWFFEDDNLELLVKVLDDCGGSGYHWVFASGLTTVQVEITVTDTETGATWTHTNPLGNKFDLVTDLQAFSCL